MAPFMITLIIDNLIAWSILDSLGNIQIFLAAIEARTTFGRLLSSEKLNHLLCRQISQAIFTGHWL
jgi:hypothetical protein